MTHDAPPGAVSDRFDMFTRTERPDLGALMDVVVEQAWAATPFIYPNDVEDAYQELLRETPAFTFGLVERATGRLAAVGNAAPIAVRSDDLAAPPDSGWRWQVLRAKAVRDGDPPTHLGAFTASVSPLFRGQGVSALVVAGFKALARRSGLAGVLAPVRPPSKASCPRIDIEAFLDRAREDGLPADPWVRTHVRIGGRIAGTPRRALVVDLELDFWEVWLGRPILPSELSFEIPGGLAPVYVQGRRGRYEEPAVWIVHSL
ncbi:hypothetical protein [Sorangium sp. So ce426]|uniref:hypothetical protein n=1 Tax=Sorangium sp. So ce426 TaxID=3133312 RepID=UPI003F5B772A